MKTFELQLALLSYATRDKLRAAQERREPVTLRFTSTTGVRRNMALTTLTDTTAVFTEITVK